MLLWRPFLGRLVTGLAERLSPPCVYLLLGEFARKLFVDLIQAGASGKPAPTAAVAAVNHWHPAYYRFAESNPFIAVNAGLSKLDSPPVAW